MAVNNRAAQLHRLWLGRQQNIYIYKNTTFGRQHVVDMHTLGRLLRMGDSFAVSLRFPIRNCLLIAHISSTYCLPKGVFRHKTTKYGLYNTPLNVTLRKSSKYVQWKTDAYRVTDSRFSLYITLCCLFLTKLATFRGGSWPNLIHCFLGSPDSRSQIVSEYK